MEPVARMRASPEQFSALIEFMERHGDLSRPQPSAQGRIKGDRLWLQCAALLNSIGGGIVKSHDKWKKVWSDWKTKTKKKHLLIRQHASGTGGGPSSRLRLTALEERVVAIIGQTAVGGQIIPEHGVIELSAPTVQPLAPVLEVPDIHLPLLIPSPPPPGPLAPPPGPALTPAPGPLAPAPGPLAPPPRSLAPAPTTSPPLPPRPRRHRLVPHYGTGTNNQHLHCLQLGHRVVGY